MQVFRSGKAELDPLLCNIDFAFTVGFYLNTSSLHWQQMEYWCFGDTYKFHSSLKCQHVFKDMFHPYLKCLKVYTRILACLQNTAKVPGLVLLVPKCLQWWSQQFFQRTKLQALIPYSWYRVILTMTGHIRIFIHMYSVEFRRIYFWFSVPLLGCCMTRTAV